MCEIRREEEKQIELTDQEMQILLKGFEADYDAYYKELDSRRDYLKWYTSMVAAGVVVAGYLMQKNMPLTIVVLAALFLLGISTFRVVLSSSISALYAFVRFNAIHQCWNLAHPKIATWCPPHELTLDVGSQATIIALLRMPLPHILQIIITINAIIGGCLAGVCAWVFIDERRPSILFVYVVGILTITYIILQCFSVAVYYQSKELVEAASRTQIKESRKNEEEKKTNSRSVQEQG